jgi:hypothetical protein
MKNLFANHRGMSLQVQRGMTTAVRAVDLASHHCPPDRETRRFLRDIRQFFFDPDPLFNRNFNITFIAVDQYISSPRDAVARISIMLGLQDGCICFNTGAFCGLEEEYVELFKIDISDFSSDDSIPYLIAWEALLTVITNSEDIDVGTGYNDDDKSIDFYDSSEKDN